MPQPRATAKGLQPLSQDMFSAWIRGEQGATHTGSVPCCHCLEGMEGRPGGIWGVRRLGRWHLIPGRQQGKTQNQASHDTCSIVHQTSLPKHKSKASITENFKTMTTELNPLLSCTSVMLPTMLTMTGLLPPPGWDPGLQGDALGARGPFLLQANW